MRLLVASFCIVFTLVCSADTGTKPDKTTVAKPQVSETPSYPDSLPAPAEIYADYTPRFITRLLPNESMLMLDTADGVVYTAQQSRSTLNVWRQYSLTKIAVDLKKQPVEIRSATMKNKIIYGRFTMKDRGDIILFIDTLTGRVWGCRHDEGVLDMWKCYDPHGKSGNI